jgi:hypothetical protein
VNGERRSYLYALVRPADIAIDATGIDAAPVRIVSGQDIGAVVSTVSADTFDPALMEDRMADLQWVETVARAHDDVVNAAARVATTIPLRLGTTSDDDDTVRELVTDLTPAARRSFDRLQGRAEYGVQVFGPARRATTAAARSEGGAAFLRRRRAELQQDEVERAAVAEQATTAFDSLARLAADSRRNPLRDVGPGVAGTMLLNGAFLIEQDEVPAFRTAVDDLAAAFGPQRVVITGPWAPYSFADLEP